VSLWQRRPGVVRECHATVPNALSTSPSLPGFSSSPESATFMRNLLL